MLTKRLLFIALLLTCSRLIWAQEPASADSLPPLTPAPESPKQTVSTWDRIRFGGNFGLQFGDITVVELSPRVGYMFTDKLLAGLGFTYEYYRERMAYYEISTSVYGGSAFTNYMVYNGFFAQAELDHLYVGDLYRKLGYTEPPEWVTGVLIGGGYRAQLGAKFGVSLTLLFNVNESTYWPYQNPIMRVGFGF